MGKGFSASTIKSWFQYRCERKVRYELSTEAELAAVPIAKDVREQAWALLGTQFEERVTRRLHREVGVLRPAAGNDALSERLTGAFLRGQCDERYAAQVNLRPNALPRFPIGRAPGRERGCQYVSISGVAGTLTKNKNKNQQ